MSHLQSPPQPKTFLITQESLPPQDPKALALKTIAAELAVMKIPYSSDAFLSSGSYGIVVAGTDHLAAHGKPCAIKRVHATRTGHVTRHILQDEFLARRVIREVSLLAHFNHPNILGLRDLFLFKRAEPNDLCLYLVTDLLHTDLSQLIKDTRIAITREHVQHYMYHVLLGLHCLHHSGVVHRDLHPANVLLSKNNDVKICDFNLAREDTQSNDKTYYVTHRWYRAPELVMQHHGFTKIVDVWSAGCIMAELYTRKPLFRGTTFYNQLNKIIEVVGTPKREDYVHFASPSAAEYLASLPPTEPIPWHLVVPGANEVAIDLLSKMLTFNPAKRITAEEALRHPFFKELYEESDITDNLSVPFHFVGENMPLPGLHQLLIIAAGSFTTRRDQRMRRLEELRRAQQAKRQSRLEEEHSMQQQQPMQQQVQQQRVQQQPQQQPQQVIVDHDQPLVQLMSISACNSGSAPAASSSADDSRPRSNSGSGGVLVGEHSIMSGSGSSSSAPHEVFAGQTHIPRTGCVLSELANGVE